jgi:hypothetical protein
LVAVVGWKVYEVPISRHFFPKPRLLTPEDDGVPAQAMLLAVLLRVQLAAGEDAVIFGKILVPLVCLKRALPDEAWAAVRQPGQQGHELPHQDVVPLGCVVVGAVFEADAIRRVGYHALDG